MCHYCERPCWRDGSDGGLECDYTDEEWERMEAEEWDDLNRRYGITSPAASSISDVLTHTAQNGEKIDRMRGGPSE
jgi:hypothetical protein